MKISLKAALLKNLKNHTVIIPVYQQGASLELPQEATYLKALFEKIKKEKSFEGKFRQSIHVRFVKMGEAENVLFLGVGSLKELTGVRLREALISAASHLARHKVPTFSFHLSTAKILEGLDIESRVQLAAEALVLPLYQFNKYKKELAENSGVQSVTIGISQNDSLTLARQGLKKAEILIEACNMVRDLVSTPSNDLRTDLYAKKAKEIGESVGLHVIIFGEKELTQMGFNALLAVNKGSDQPPRLVVLEYNGGKKDLDTICLVGKGITFDTGGISLKPAAGMEDMKYDMAGSATVLGILTVVAKLKLPLRVIGIMAITDNMPSGKATVPGDIVTSYLGKTIEILNTDAEGRLILADALAYADEQYKPDLMIDFATLTGACVIALGQAGSGMMGTDQESMNRFIALANQTGEKVWQLPLWEEFKEELKSDNADIKNVGTTRGGGSSQGGSFLREFVSEKTPWIHFDIAGSAHISKPTYRYAPKGATASCVRLVSEFLIQFSI